MIRAALQQYADERIAPSPYLRIILENDLRRAADEMPVRFPLGSTLQMIKEICPPESYGSPEKVAAWLGETPRKVLK